MRDASNGVMATIAGTVNAPPQDYAVVPMALPLNSIADHVFVFFFSLPSFLFPFFPFFAGCVTSGVNVPFMCAGMYVIRSPGKQINRPGGPRFIGTEK